MAKNKYGEKEYKKDSEIFEPESITDGEPLSEKAFQAQKRLNAHPEVGEKYYKKYPERLQSDQDVALNAYKNRHKEHR